MAENVGRGKCALCGAEHQDLRVNKNGGLYIYCDHGCAVRFSKSESKKALADLRQGNQTKLCEKVYTSIFNKGVIENGQRGNTVNGRANGGDTGAGLTSAPVAAPRRSFFESLLDDE